MYREIVRIKHKANQREKDQIGYDDGDEFVFQASIRNKRFGEDMVELEERDARPPTVQKLELSDFLSAKQKRKLGLES